MATMRTSGMWFLKTVAVGIGVLCRVGRCIALHRAWGSPIQRCPRGHVVIVSGVYSCRVCGSRYEGLAWERCPICHAPGGYVACASCGLSVRNPKG